MSAKHEKELKADNFAFNFTCNYINASYHKFMPHHVHGLYTTYLASSLIGDPKAISDDHPSIESNILRIKSRMSNL